MRKIITPPLIHSDGSCQLHDIVMWMLTYRTTPGPHSLKHPLYEVHYSLSDVHPDNSQRDAAAAVMKAVVLKGPAVSSIAYTLFCTADERNRPIYQMRKQ